MSFFFFINFMCYFYVIYILSEYKIALKITKNEFKIAKKDVQKIKK
jgi:hypothetical protein